MKQKLGSQISIILIPFFRFHQSINLEFLQWKSLMYGDVLVFKINPAGIIVAKDLSMGQLQKRLDQATR